MPEAGKGFHEIPHDREDGPVIVDSVMLDHLSWLSIDTGTAYRAVRSGDSVWALTCAPCDTGGHETAARLVSGAGDPPVMD